MSYKPDWKQYIERYTPGTSFPFEHSKYRIDAHDCKLISGNILSLNDRINRYEGYLWLKQHKDWRHATPHEYEIQAANRPRD